ncbi:MAG TPA: GntR family transcriptional regulator, partial [Rhodothermales bacterium]
REGLIEGRGGSGYVVRGRSTTARGERMEEGAAVFQDALRRLVGMGLAPDEIDYLFQEQIELVTAGQDERTLLFAAPSLELAELCAAQVGHVLQRSVEAVSIDGLARHGDVDVVYSSFEHVRRVMAAAPRADVQGVVVHLNPDALERIVRLLEDETLGLVARAEESVPALIEAVRAETDFRGQMLAFSSDARADELEQLIEQATLIAYTPAARRALHAHLKNPATHVQVRPIVRIESLEAARAR